MSFHRKSKTQRKTKSVPTEDEIAELKSALKELKRLMDLDTSKRAIEDERRRVQMAKRVARLARDEGISF